MVFILVRVIYFPLQLPFVDVVVVACIDSLYIAITHSGSKPTYYLTKYILYIDAI